MMKQALTAETPAPQRAAADRVVEFFETLTPESLDRLDDFYTPRVYFKDPFNEEIGRAHV